MPNVTVIIPNYNHERFLAHRIDSVLNQSYQDFEVIILDDCSSDSSKSIIEAYKGHPKVTHILFNEQNSGSTFKQWDRGFALAVGKYVWIAESDDTAHRNFLEHSVKLLHEDEDVNITSSNFNLINTEGQVFEDNLFWSCYYEPSQEEYIIHDGSSFIKKYMLKYNSLLNASGIVFKREVLAHVSSEYKKYRLCGDWVFWTEIIALGKVGIVKLKLNNFRCHSSSVRTKEKLYDVVREEYASFYHNQQIVPLSFAEKDAIYQYKLVNNAKLINNNKALITAWQKKIFYKDPLVFFRILDFIITSEFVKRFPWLNEKIRRGYFLCIAMINKIKKLTKRNEDPFLIS